MDFKTAAEESLNNKDYNNYYNYCMKQYHSTNSNEDKDTYFKAKKMLETHKEITEMLKIDQNDYYKILKVNKNSSEDEIKSAYRKMVVLYHPNVCKVEGCSEVFMRVRTAYYVLNDKSKRMEYDRKINQQNTTANGFNNAYRRTNSTFVASDFSFFEGGFMNDDFDIYRMMYNFAEMNNRNRRVYVNRRRVRQNNNDLRRVIIFVLFFLFSILFF